MASQEQLRAMFNGMNTDQKGQFINNFKKAIDANDNSENAKFLNECIIQYNDELNNNAQADELEVVKPPEKSSDVIKQFNEQESKSDVEFSTDSIFESDLEHGHDPELESESDVVNESQETNTNDEINDYVRERITASTNTTRTDDIGIGISELHKNIQYYMSVIDTITHLLTGTDGKTLEDKEQIDETKPVLFPEMATNYEDKISNIEENFSELADKLRHDMSVIMAISNLLSGTRDNAINSFEMQKKNKITSAQQADDIAIDQNPMSSAEDIEALRYAVNELSELVQSIRGEVSSLNNAVIEFSDASESLHSVISFNKTTDIQQSVEDSGVTEDGENDPELSDYIFDNAKQSEAEGKTENTISGKKTRNYILSAFYILAIIALIFFLPVTRWIVLAVSLIWLGLSFIKKPIKLAGYEINLNANKLTTIIASSVAVILVIIMPIIGGIFSDNGGAVTDSISDSGSQQNKTGSSGSNNSVERVIQNDDNTSSSNDPSNVIQDNNDEPATGRIPSGVEFTGDAMQLFQMTGDEVWNQLSEKGIRRHELEIDELNISISFINVYDDNYDNALVDKVQLRTGTATTFLGFKPGDNYRDIDDVLMRLGAKYLGMLSWGVAVDDSVFVVRCDLPVANGESVRDITVSITRNTSLEEKINSGSLGFGFDDVMREQESFLWE